MSTECNQICRNNSDIMENDAAENKEPMISCSAGDISLDT